ncbi:MarR family transcriptional regulator [Paraburkholderia sp. IMGN_8]|uniref:MarR family winged helix-turn-helix transcriptional regulator n=1 Tax=Paraburkholderia sp. IMGN_8 TaxID=3136564 RepID=UPI003100B293
MKTSSNNLPGAAEVQLGDEVGFSLYATSLAMTKAYKPLLQPLGLTYPQYIAMLSLWESDEVTVKALSTRLSLDPATITPLLKRLESQGLVSRTRGITDERLVFVSLTTKGDLLRRQAALIPAAITEATGQSNQVLLRLKRDLDQLRSRL